MLVQLIRLLTVLVFLSAYGGALADSGAAVDRFSKQRQLYLQLDAMLQSGELDRVADRRTELDGYPLQGHLDYLLLRKEIAAASEPSRLLKRVDALNDDKRLQRRLLGAIKDRSVELSLWQDYRAASARENAPVHPCDDLLVSIKDSHNGDGKVRQFNKSSRDLWADIGKHTANCNEAFSLLLASVPDVPTGPLWRRTVALIKRGKIKSAESLLKYFNQRDAQVVQAWIDGHDKPDQLLTSEIVRGNSVHHQEIATFSLRRWARQDLLAASEFWRRSGEWFGISDETIEKTLAAHAVLAAKRGMPEAKGLLSNVDATRDVRFWRVRLELQEKNWQGCISTIDQLTPDEQAQSRWTYWRARCLEAQGFRAAAERVYKSIAGEFEYYGFLAADKLSQDYQIKTSTPLVNGTELQALRESPGIVKAIEYFLVGLPWEGRRQWNREMKSSSKARYLASAYLAESVGWYDRALDSVRTSGEPEVLALMFPLAHAQYVDSMASRFSVPREFVYGVMRRESGYISDIKSPAGAVGLMQLMPRTAKQMAGELGIKAPKWKLIDSELNIKLGVKYLNYVLGRFDNNIALAAAAYNAGPSRVKKWIADRPLDTDLWVETIPFDETRAYVQAVLFNTAVSEWLLRDGAVTRLEQRMAELPLPAMVSQ